MARGKRASSSASDTNHLAGDSLTESFSPSGGAFETESSQISKVARGRPSRDMQGGAATSFEDEARKTPSKLKATVSDVQSRQSLSLDLEDTSADGTSPRSPGEETPTPRQEAWWGEEVDVDANLGRSGAVYTIFMLAAVLLLPAFTLFALFCVWICYLVPNEVSAFALFYAGALSGVTFMGVSGARNSLEPRLQFFSFMMLLCITMQVSVFLVVSIELDGGEMIQSYLDSFELGLREMCSDVDDLPFGATALPMDDLCACVADELADGAAVLPSDSGGSATGISTDTVKCVQDVLAEKVGLGDSGHVLPVVVLALELLMARVAWIVMQDLDTKEHEIASKKPGGLQLGTLSGTILAGSNLRAANAAVPTSKKKKRGKRKKKQGPQATRSCWLTVLTPGVENEKHVRQILKSPKIEDDANPLWEHPFGNIAMYKGSTTLNVRIMDHVGVDDVLVGSKDIELDGATVPEYELEMDMAADDKEEGDDVIVVNLSHLVQADKKTGQVQVDAGSVSLSLTYVPAPTPTLRTAVAVTKSWYFEATVLFTVALSMLCLALQSPAQPTVGMWFGLVLILEIFIAVYMLVELMLEVYVAHIDGVTARHMLRTDHWFQLACFVLLCNWICIIQPQQLQQAAQSSKLQKFFSVGRVFRIVRPIRTLRMLKDVRIVVAVIEDSMHLFLTVCALLLLCLGIFALIGMSNFGGALQFSCLSNSGPTNEGPKPECSAAEYAQAEIMGIDCPVMCAQSLKCSADHYWCAPLPEKREIGWDQWGLRNFDDFNKAMLAIFVQTTGDGGMHAVTSALHDAGINEDFWAWVVHFLASVFLSLIALNLFLAVCCSAYADIVVRMDEREREKLRLVAVREAAERQLETPEERDQRQREAEEYAESIKPIELRVQEKDWLAEAELNGRSTAWAAVRARCRDLVIVPGFEHVTSFLIVCNTVTMALVYEGMDQSLEKTLVAMELVFWVLFATEATLKIVGMGSTLYCQGKSNLFDLSIVLISAYGWGVTFYKVNGASDEMQALQAARAVRLLRALQVTRLLMRNKGLRQLLSTIFKVWKPLCVHLVFSLFSMCMFTIIGMHLFGGSLGCEVSINEDTGLCPEGRLSPLATCAAEFESCVPATAADYNGQLFGNYETFASGMFACFELTVGEEWSETMYWYMHHAHEGHEYPQMIIELFFVAMFLWMNCILFSLGVAMLLQNFVVPEPDKMPMQKRVYDRDMARQQKKQDKLAQKFGQRTETVLLDTVREHQAKGGSAKNLESIFDKFEHFRSTASDTDVTCGKFSLSSPIRRQCAKILDNPRFTQMILLLILLSCLALAIEGPPESEAWVHRNAGWIFSVVNFLVLFMFTVEMTLKIICHGFYKPSGPTKPYLASRMNRIDFAIITLSLLSYMPYLSISGAWARALRIGRLITPLLNLVKSPEINLVFISFVRAVPETLVVLIPVGLLGIVFAIIGQTLFGGQMKACYNVATSAPRGLDGVELPEEDIPSFHWCTEQIATWVDNLNGTMRLEVTCSHGNGSTFVWNQTDEEILCDAYREATNTSDAGVFMYEYASPAFNFDTSTRALALLFAASTDGAHEIMVVLEEKFEGALWYWVMYHLVFTCFFLNLFLGVLSGSFEKSSGVAVMTILEKQWLATLQRMRTFQPTLTDVEDYRPLRTARCCGRPTPIKWFEFRNWCFNMATNEKVEHVWRFAIIANTVTLATDTYPITEAHFTAVGHLNNLFLFICSVEVLLKFTGFGFRKCFGDGWFMSDFVLVTVSLAVKIGGVRSGVGVLRVMRVFRMLVLASKFPSLVQLIDTVASCVKASFALLIITSLLVYLFGVMGMNIFGALPFDAGFQGAGVPCTVDTVGAPLCVLSRERDGDDNFVESPDTAACNQDAPQVCSLGLDCQRKCAHWQDLRAGDSVLAAVCPDCGSYNDYTNFKNFFSSFKLLIQVVFQQELFGFVADMHELGASYWGIVIFFVTFYVVVVWVCINLLVVTVLTHFDTASVGVDPEHGLTVLDMDGFAHTWASLTLGIHSTEVTQNTDEALLKHVGEYQAAHRALRANAEASTSAAFEDGDPSLCGTAELEIVRVHGATHDTIRPSVAKQLVGNGWSYSSVRYTGATTQQMKSSEGPAARWTNHWEESAPTRLHVTAHHRYLELEVTDTFQFCNGEMGRAAISMEELREANNFDGGADSDGFRSITVPLLARRRERRSAKDLEATFDAFDTQDTGELDRVQLAQLMGRMRWPLSTLDDLLSLEADKAGVRVHVDEFTEWYGHMIDQLNGFYADSQDVAPSSDLAPYMVDPKRDRSTCEHWSRFQANHESSHVSSSRAPQAKKLDELREGQESQEEEHDTLHADGSVMDAKEVEKQQEFLNKRERKRHKKALKAAQKQEKQQKKQKKKLEKMARKEAKKNKNKKERGQEEDEEDTSAEDAAEDAWSPFARAKGYVPTGVSVELRWKYTSQLREVPTLSFMAEQSENYLHKEVDCGIRGWMFVSQDEQALKRCYCYMQNAPVPCMRIVENATNSAELFDIAQQGLLQITTVHSSEIVRMRSGHDMKVSKYPKSSHHNFQVDAECTDASSDMRQELKIGHISGKVLFGADLQPPLERDVSGVLHVGNVGDRSEDDLRAHFQQFGTCEDISVRKREGKGGANTSWALVTMNGGKAAKLAIAADNGDMKVKQFDFSQAKKSTGSIPKLRTGVGKHATSSTAAGVQMLQALPVYTDPVRSSGAGTAAGNVSPGSPSTSPRSAYAWRITREDALADYKPEDGAIPITNMGEPVLRFLCVDGPVEAHSGSDDSTDLTDNIQEGEYINVTHTKLCEDGTLRLRCLRGWVKLWKLPGLSKKKSNKTAGSPSFMPSRHFIGESDTNRFFRVLKKTQIGNTHDLGSSVNIGKVSKGAVVEVTETAIDGQTGVTRHRIRYGMGLQFGVVGTADKSGWVSETDVNLEATPDPFCTIEIVAAGEEDDARAAAHVRTNIARWRSFVPETGLCTQTVDDSLAPQWDEEFNFDVCAISSCLVIRVWDHCGSEAKEMGMATVAIGNPQDGFAGPQLRGDCLLAQSTEMAHLRVEGWRRSGADGTIVRTSQKFDDWDKQHKLESVMHLQNDSVPLVVGLRDRNGTACGVVGLRLAYHQILSPLQMRRARDHNGGQMAGALTTPAKIGRAWRFRVTEVAQRMPWLVALRWLAEGASPDRMPGPIPAPTLSAMELEKCTENISLVHMPMWRIPQLIQGLYDRRLLGSRKPTLRRRIYTLFNLETHGHAIVSAGKKSSSKAGLEGGATVDQLCGLNFHSVLERLVMIHMGKRRCMSYKRQVLEYESERKHIALNVIHTCLGFWVFRRRLHKTVNGYPWPYHRVWRAFPNAFLAAVEGIAVTRLMSLRMLSREVERYSRPKLLDKVLKPTFKEQELAEVKTLIEAQLCCGKGRDTPDDDSPGSGLAFTENPSFENDTEAGNVSPRSSIAGRKIHTVMEIWEIYKKIDNDGSDSICVEELDLALEELGLAHDAETVARVMREVDDDDNGHLDFTEFIEFYERYANVKVKRRDAWLGGTNESDSDSDLDDSEMFDETFDGNMFNSRADMEKLQQKMSQRGLDSGSRLHL